jgi:hypothetical protein
MDLSTMGQTFHMEPDMPLREEGVARTGSSLEKVIPGYKRLGSKNSSQEKLRMGTYSSPGAGPRISGTFPLTVPVAGSLPASSPMRCAGPFGEAEPPVPVLSPVDASPVLGPVMSGTALRMVSLAGSFP